MFVDLESIRRGSLVKLNLSPTPTFIKKIHLKVESGILSGLLKIVYL